MLRYRRPASTGTTVADDVVLCTSLLAHLGIARPHVAGHSSGGLVALEVARRTDVASLALLEPATAGLLDTVTAADRVGGLLEPARASGARAAMAAFLTAVCGEDAASRLDRRPPAGGRATRRGRRRPHPLLARRGFSGEHDGAHKSITGSP